MTMRLGDDGTLDTVIYCDNCNQEFRFNYSAFDYDATLDNDLTDEAAYMAFVEWCKDEAAQDHNCDIHSIGEYRSLHLTTHCGLIIDPDDDDPLRFAIITPDKPKRVAEITCVDCVKAYMAQTVYFTCYAKMHEALTTRLAELN